MMSARRTLPLLQTTPLSLRAIGVSNTNVMPFSLDNLKKASLHCPAQSCLVADALLLLKE